MSEIDVSKCEYYNNNYCSCYRDNYGDCYHKCTDEELNDCLYKQLQQLKAENEELKRLMAKQKNAKIQLSKLKDNQYKEFCDMKQCLDAIEEIANDDSFPSDFDVYEERDFYFNQLCKIDNILQKIKQAKEGGE